MFIQVPEKVIDENKVSNGAMLTLGAIISLSKARLGCIVSNKKLAKRFHCDVRTIQNHIKELETNLYIKVKEIPKIEYPEQTVRTIVPTKNILTSIEEAEDTLNKVQKQYIKNKNLLPRDIESDWLDDYIAKTR